MNCVVMSDSTCDFSAPQAKLEGVRIIPFHYEDAAGRLPHVSGPGLRAHLPSEARRDRVDSARIREALNRKPVRRAGRETSLAAKRRQRRQHQCRSSHVLNPFFSVQRHDGEGCGAIVGDVQAAPPYARRKRRIYSCFPAKRQARRRRYAESMNGSPAQADRDPQIRRRSRRCPHCHRAGLHLLPLHQLSVSLGRSELLYPARAGNAHRAHGADRAHRADAAHRADKAVRGDTAH